MHPSCPWVTFLSLVFKRDTLKDIKVTIFFLVCDVNSLFKQNTNISTYTVILKINESKTPVIMLAQIIA